MYNESLDLEIRCRHARDTLPSLFAPHNVAYNKRVFTI